MKATKKNTTETSSRLRSSIRCSTSGILCSSGLSIVMKPSSAGRAFHALGYRAKLCCLCDSGCRQRGRALARRERNRGSCLVLRRWGWGGRGFRNRSRFGQGGHDRLRRRGRLGGRGRLVGIDLDRFLDAVGVDQLFQTFLEVGRRDLLDFLADLVDRKST